MKQEFETEITSAIIRLELTDKAVCTTMYKLYQYAKMLENDYHRQMKELLKHATEQTLPGGKVDIKEK